MKSPREILFARHRAADAKLDAVREQAVAAVCDRQTKATKSKSVTDLRCNEIGFWRELFSFGRPAWAGLAAIWILIFALRFSTPDGRIEARESTPVAPEVIAQVRKQKLLFAELAGVTPSPATKSSKPAADRPRSERRHGFPVG